MSQRIKIIAGVVVLVVVLGGIYFYQGKGGETGSIKVGFIGALTGDAASIGAAAQKGMELAVKEINEAGGVNGRIIEAIYEDGKCMAAPASSAANKLMNVDKVGAIIGGLCSGETAAFAPAAMQNKTIVISYCSSAPDLSKTGKYFFRTYPSDSLQGKFAAEFAYNTLGKRTAAIVYHVSPWGSGLTEVFKKRFEELGGAVLVSEGMQQTDKDYRSVLSKVKAANPDIVFAPTYSIGASVLVKQYVDLGITVQLMGGDAWEDKAFFTEATKTLNGRALYSVTAAKPTKEFEGKLKAYATGVENVAFCGPQAYDAVRILAETIRNVGANPDKVADALHALRDYDGVSGKISFDANGDITHAEYIVKVIKDGMSKEAYVEE
ncbi:ABC transporter substrate-binding protein [Candidatus Wolfebacteria bacterium]|nr:ABC transporter substrate-binding protein [Candidatus Wolfebacteria bacterium]